MNRVPLSRNIAFTLLAAAALASLPGASLLRASAQNLITNPSFETGSFVDGGAGSMTLPIGSTAIDGWTTTDAAATWITTPNTLGYSASQGNRFLILAADTGAPITYAGVQQTIATTIGQQYLFTCDLGTYRGDPGVDWFVSATISVSPSITASTSFFPAGPGSQWDPPRTFSFTAQQAATLINIRAAPNTFGAAALSYIGLDNVSVTLIPPVAPVNATPQASTSTAIPGGTGNFTGFAAPSLSGGRTAFYGTGSGGQTGIYMAPPSPGINGIPPSPVKIADLNTAIPGGTGNFTSFYPPGPFTPPSPLIPPDPCISGENVAFFGAGADGQQGIYVAYPPSPGLPPSPIKFADLNTAIPGGTGNFTSFYPPSPNFPPGPQISGQNVAFYGEGSAGQKGVYVIYPPSPLVPTDVPPSPYNVADQNTPIPGGVGNFDFAALPPQPCISGQNVAFLGAGSGGQRGIYIAIPPSPYTPPSPLLVADLNTAIPGGTGLFTTFEQVALFDQNVAFIGGGVEGQRGVYVSVPPSPLTPETWVPPSPSLIANLDTLIPGGIGAFTGFDAVDLSETDLVFLGLGSNGQKGIFDFTGGKLISVVTVGSTLDGKTISDLSFARGGLFADPIAFQAFFDDGSQGIYVAAVPEPATLLLTVGLGAGALGFRPRRRRR